ncbi:MAG: hypothetical protein REI96_07485 [Flavobacterium nitrogenifigens]|uniref:hypothetical protein n=1 Tax=Flavobacterium nitrogenifigens TaxID=1617283 RepID=UPI002809FF18|nr:hypothetical protein [Flavobacterium nitrogenifigens]MDQ8012271.1 hypothetical protein [Flavobacterium nitrogenifigens]
MKEKNTYKDDISIPKETIIYHSKTALLFSLAFYVGIILLGIYFIYNEDYFGLLFLGLGIYSIYIQIKKLRDKRPQIIINAEGIKLKDEDLVSWENIKNERIFTKFRRYSSTNYFGFNDKQIEIGELDIHFDNLENLLHVYRVRFENNNS